MWKSLAEFILRYRLLLLSILLAATGFMAWQAMQVKLSYDFARAIPTDHPKYKAYQNFRSTYGEDGNLLVIGIESKEFFQTSVFNDYNQLIHDIRKINGVEDILSVPTSVNLLKDSATERLKAVPIFTNALLTQQQLDSNSAAFLNLPFYRNLLYNPESAAWLAGIRINKEIMSSKGRVKLVNDIVALADAFGTKHKIEMHYSGLPHIRTMVASKIENEMKWFTIGSITLSALILLLFFRSLSATLLSLAVVVIGVIWSFGTVHLMGYKITLLTALIPPLIVVIGIPNCIYFLNKFHTSYRDVGDKRSALVQMITKMGIVTLFCNIAAAIGFAVFALTSSAILKEFGYVAGFNIMMLFFISLVLIPSVLSMMAPPKPAHTRYLDNKRLQRWLARMERWSLHHRRLIYIATTVLVLISVVGIFKLKSVGYIVDDLPKTDKIYTDLKFFEQHFKGVMPLEILVDTKKPRGVTRIHSNLEKLDSLSTYLAQQPYIGKPLSIAEGLKFAKQAFFEGDSGNYSMPSEYDLPGLASYLSQKSNDGTGNSFTRLVSSFMDSTQSEARISVNMKDVGSARLPFILDSIESKANQLFDTSKYDVELTGTSVTFLEGSSFIINGLKESIFWAFLLITACMLYLFRSLRILVCSLLPNVIPLVITAGLMGWAGVPLKPSTVLVFSVALGIAIDITIRFLVNYKQEPGEKEIEKNVIQTIHSTGLSIIYTSIVLIAGFVIFCFSGFGGTQALGWLTSLTLVVATLANLTLLPALLITLAPLKKKKSTI